MNWPFPWGFGYTVIAAIKIETLCRMIKSNSLRGVTVFRKSLVCIVMLAMAAGASDMAAYGLPYQDAPKKPETWDVEGDHGPTTTLEFDTDEGTWMSCDVSPDGKTLEIGRAHV